MENKYDVNELTAEQKAGLEKIEELLADENNWEKFRAMQTAEEVIAFYEENGFTYTEDEKKKICEVFEELKEKISQGELSEEELEMAAGGWDWGYFAAGASGGAFIGGLFAGGMAFICASNPIGWAVGGALVVGGVLGGGMGAAS